MTLIGHWLASGASGTTMPDISGGGLNGTLSAGSSIVTLANGETAVSCPSGECVSVSDHAKWNLTDFTMIVRFQRDSYDAPVSLINHTPGAGAVNKWMFWCALGILVWLTSSCDSFAESRPAELPRPAQDGAGGSASASKGG